MPDTRPDCCFTIAIIGCFSRPTTSRKRVTQSLIELSPGGERRHPNRSSPTLESIKRVRALSSTLFCRSCDAVQRAPQSHRSLFDFYARRQAKLVDALSADR